MPISPAKRRSGIYIAVSEPFPYFWHRKRRRFTVWKLYRRQSQMPKRMPFETTSQCRIFVGKAEEVYPAYCAAHGEEARAEVIVVDPPRKGCEESLLAMMCEMAPQRIVYVSCDSATLARDLKYLCSHGYDLVEVQPVDQFGHTVHIETVVFPRALKVRWTFAQREPKWNGEWSTAEK